MTWVTKDEWTKYEFGPKEVYVWDKCCLVTYGQITKNPEILDSFWANEKEGLWGIVESTPKQMSAFGITPSFSKKCKHKKQGIIGTRDIELKGAVTAEPERTLLLLEYLNLLGGFVDLTGMWQYEESDHTFWARKVG